MWQFFTFIAFYACVGAKQADQLYSYESRRSPGDERRRRSRPHIITGAARYERRYLADHRQPAVR